jgi:polyisoprenoid-binding protein YceI
VHDHQRVPTVTLSPDAGTLVLRTGVEGRAARLGHRLHLVVAAWECRAQVEDGVPVSVELRAQLPSLQVVSGDGGLKPLSDKDRLSIRDNALKTLRADRYPEVVFVSSAVQVAARGWSLLGDLTLANATAPVAVDVTTAAAPGGQRLTGRATVRQSLHRVRPFSTMMGALQVSDGVGIELVAVVAGD